MGLAAIRDQKIGNAIRTIDYSGTRHHAEVDRPIPIEPNGAESRSNGFPEENHSTALALLKTLLRLIRTRRRQFMIAC